MELRLRQIGHVTREGLGVLVKALAHQYPSHMRPPLAIDGRMGIALFVGILMMNAVRGHPENWSAFKRQRGTDRQRILNPLRSLVAAMRQQPVISHPNSEAAGNPPHEGG